ncbi:MAG: hypothetical protein QOG43_2255 [Actinomycetota bacterium]|jgi:exopolysaccharide biosynthesis polyprenyl glycosylphosphotransferase|nr:hypothetical protein [Actinomycetota bacterium]
MLLDAIAATVAWSFALTGLKPPAGVPEPSRLWAVAMLVPAALALLAGQRLYQARVCSVRSVETQGLVRTALLTAALAVVAGGRWHLDVHDAAVGAGLMFVLLRSLRSGFCTYLEAGRKEGRFRRPVVLVGDNEEADHLYRLLGQHPELGFEVVGFVAETGACRRFDIPYLGPVGQTEQAVARAGATGVVVAATALTYSQLNRLARDLTEKSIHVHLSSGVRGIAQNRLRAQPLAYEPLFYVEPVAQMPWSLAAKRGLDIVLATLGLVIALPALAVAAVAIKLQDGGSILFRQRRVGRDGQPFTMVKLRTMVPDAEGQYLRLAVTRAGREGPLVKLNDDPRITRVGHLLRASSLDEVPQLFNVLTGSMSMVGPRPNLLVEAAGLDEEFLERKSRVRPGITGLWQIEARDNPSFDVYRRLDLFYLENWSMGLDATILLATFRKVLGRAFGLLLPAGRRAQPGGLPSLSLH